MRIFLVDDHEVVRAGLRALIDSQPDMAVVGEAGGAAGAADAIIASGADVAVLDNRLGDGSGIEVCRDVVALAPDVKCLILTSFADDRAIIDASVAGASGYVLKQINGDGIIEAVRAVGTGRRLLDDAEVRMARRRQRASGDSLWDELTPQERRIVLLIGQGNTNLQIARELFIAEKTVKNHLTMLFAKLGVERRTEVAVLAERWKELA